MKTKIQKAGLRLLLGLGLVATAQNAQTIQPCNTYAAMEAYFASNPEARVNYEKNQEKLNAEYQEALKNTQSGKLLAPPVYTIPVVFHILHEGGAENVSDATINTALAQVNSDFARQGSDVGTIAAPFQNLYVDSEIKFKLAKKDPNGNCTNGIVRYYDSKTNWAQANVLTNYVYTWDPTKYLNIYIVKNIIPQGSVAGGGIIIGYTYKPATWPTGAAQDAIVYNYSFLSGITNIRSLSHEIGHWLNLAHTFGNTNNPGVTCGDDNILDTPPTKGNFSNCPSSLTGNTCAAATTYYAAGQTNVENIMDYSSCPKNFTQGQTTAMRAALVSSASGRNNLWSSTNLTFTDVNGTTSCAPISLFASNSGYQVCSGGTLLMKDFSYNAPVSTYAWAANGGATIANPSAVNTNMTFPNTGVVTVSLTVSNAQGSSTSTRQVTVLNGVAQAPAIYAESFEANGLPANWNVINQTGGTTWQQTSLGAASGTKSYLLDGTINPNNAIDILETPSYDFLNNPNNQFFFKYAYAKYSASNTDIFKVQASKDCGGTWQDIYTPTNSSLASGSGGITTTPLVPTSAQFKTYILSNHPGFTNYLFEPNVRLRFYFQEDAAAGFGNRFFLDDINFTNPNGVNELSRSVGLSVSPNPAKESVNIKMTLSNDSKVAYSLVDVAGRLLVSSLMEELTAGEQTIQVNTKSLSSGVYFVNINLNGTTLSRKLIIE
jgi:hypothetical protein